MKNFQKKNLVHTHKKCVCVGKVFFKNFLKKSKKNKNIFMSSIFKLYFEFKNICEKLKKFPETKNFTINQN